MKLSGITPSTGTSAFAAAINYDHKSPLPDRRIDSCMKGKTFDKLPDYDEILILGGSRNPVSPSYHILAQTHYPTRTKPMDKIPQNAFLKIDPCSLEEDNDLPDFSAYLQAV